MMTLIIGYLSTHKNEDIETILKNLSIDHREIESELLIIKVK